MKYLIIIAFLVVSSETNLLCQCCAVGSPVGGTTNVGIVPEGSLRISSFYRHSYSDQYYEGDVPVDTRDVKFAEFNYIGLSLGYGILEKLSAEAEFGYFINKTHQYQFEKKSGYGLANGTFSLKYNLISDDDNSFELTMGAGLKYPFTTTPQEDHGVVLRRDIQASTGAYGGVFHLFVRKGFPSSQMSLFLINRSEYNGTNSEDYNYQFGATSITSLFLSKKIVDNLIGIIQLRHEFKAEDKQDSSTPPPSGGNIIYISPQLNFNLSDVNISLMFDYPFYKNYRQVQLGNKYAFAVNVSYLLDIFD